MAASYPKFEYFFDLPPEIREQIIQHVCVRPEGIHVCFDPSLSGDRRPGNHSLASSNNRPSGSRPSSNTQINNREEGEGEEEEDEEEEDEDAIYLPLSLLLASSQLHREASAAYYGQNVFHLHTTGGKFRSLPSPLFDPETGLLASEAALPARRRVRRAVVYVRRLGGQFERLVAPALADMVLRGALRGLDVRLWGSAGVGGPQRGLYGAVRTGLWAARAGASTATATAGGRPGAATGEPEAGPGTGSPPASALMAASAPVQAMLRLLADPDLEEVALRVEAARHWALWCWFHPAVPGSAAEVTIGDTAMMLSADDGMGMGHEGTGGGGMAGADGSGGVSSSPQRWLDIDVDALLRAFGKDGALTKIVKVEDKTW